ncbi:MAG: carboxypeptidase regulatory-like domain-containing protein, partial [bacterium]|nr:carboxypeptidase regulatory-like domain-containing protein [bacterium]
DLKPKFSRLKKPVMRVMPSTVSVLKGKNRKKFIGKTGTVKGVVLNSKGKPMAQTLVKLKGLGTARTDSRGRYVFMKVPAGNHQVIVQKSGRKPKVQQIKVAAKKSTMNRMRFLSTDRIAPKKAARKLISRTSSTVLTGRITDAKKRPVRGARVLVIQSGRSLSAVTGPTGQYRIKNLKPGAYRVLVSKSGFKNSGGTVVLRASKKKKSNYKLQPASRYIQSAIAKNRARKLTSTKKTKTGKRVVTSAPRKNVPSLKPGKKLTTT